MEVDGKQAIINRDILNRFEQLQRCTQVCKIQYFSCCIQSFCECSKIDVSSQLLALSLACRVIVVHLEILLMGTCQLYQGQRESLSDCLNDLEWPLTQSSRSRHYSTSNNSKTVQDRAIFVLADQVIYGLSNGAIFSDLEWPLPSVSRSHHSLTLNISETVQDKDIVSVVY